MSDGKVGAASLLQEEKLGGKEREAFLGQHSLKVDGQPCTLEMPLEVPNLQIRAVGFRHVLPSMNTVWIFGKLHPMEF